MNYATGIFVPFPTSHGSWLALEVALIRAASSLCSFSRQLYMRPSFAFLPNSPVFRPGGDQVFPRSVKGVRPEASSHVGRQAPIQQLSASPADTPARSGCSPPASNVVSYTAPPKTLTLPEFRPSRHRGQPRALKRSARPACAYRLTPPRTSHTRRLSSVCALCHSCSAPRALSRQQTSLWHFGPLTPKSRRGPPLFLP